MNQRREVSTIQRISITMNSFMTFSFFVTAKVEMNIPTGKILRLPVTHRDTYYSKITPKSRIKKMKKLTFEKVFSFFSMGGYFFR